MISYAVNFHAVPITYQNARKSYIVFLPVRRGFFPRVVCTCSVFPYGFMPVLLAEHVQIWRYANTVFLHPWSFSLFLNDGWYWFFLFCWFVVLNYQLAIHCSLILDIFLSFCAYCPGYCTTGPYVKDMNVKIVIFSHFWFTGRISGLENEGQDHGQDSTVSHIHMWQPRKKHRGEFKGTKSRGGYLFWKLKYFNRNFLCMRW